jgi:hypothetical protein
MTRRPLHRWTGGLLGRHRPQDLVEFTAEGLPNLRTCACRWVLGLRVGDLAGMAEAPDADRVVWAPRWVFQDALQRQW